MSLLGSLWSFFNIVVEWLVYGFDWTYWLARISFYTGSIAYFGFKCFKRIIVNQVSFPSGTLGKNYISKVFLEMYKASNAAALREFNLEEKICQAEKEFKVVDFGCGNGSSLCEIHSLLTELIELERTQLTRFHLVGIDRSNSMIEASLNTFRNYYDLLSMPESVKEKIKVEFLQDIESYSGREIDLVLCLNVIQYFTSRDSAVVIKNLASLLKVGGKLLLTFESSDCDAEYLLDSLVEEAVNMEKIFPKRQENVKRVIEENESLILQESKIVETKKENEEECKKFVFIVAQKV